MTVSDDPSGGPRVRGPISGWRSQGGRAAFWVVAAAIGVPVLCVAWFWYGFAFLEEMTDSDPGPGSSSGIGLGMLLGGIPVIVVHALLLLVLVLIGATYHSRRWVGILLAVCAVALGSGIGIALSQLLWGGCLFAMSAEQTCPAYVP